MEGIGRESAVFVSGWCQSSGCDLESAMREVFDVGGDVVVGLDEAVG
jgi:hypothetical protein